MTIGAGNAQALRCDVRLFGGDDNAVFKCSPDFHRLALGFFLLAAYIGNAVVKHFRPALKGLACAGDSLIGAGEDSADAEFLAQRRERGNIALDGAVGLNGDEAALCTKTLSLTVDNLNVVGVYFRNYHRNVGRPAVGTVV